MPRPAGWKPLNYKKIAEICARLILNESQTKIARAYGITTVSLHNMRVAMKKQGLQLGRGGPTNRLEASKLAELNRLIETTSMTNHQIAKAIGLSSSFAPRYHRKKYHQRLRDEGVPVPKCACGEEFQHPERCRFNHGSVRRSHVDVPPEEAAVIVKELVAGDLEASIKKAHGIGHRALDHFKGRLSKRQRVERKQNFRHPKTLRKNQEEARLLGSALLATFTSSLPRTLEPCTRDDAAANMCLTALCGKMSVQEIVSRRSEFVRAVLRDYADKWQTISIDVDEDHWSERLEDERAFAAFSQPSWGPDRGA